MPIHNRTTASRYASFCNPDDGPGGASSVVNRLAVAVSAMMIAISGCGSREAPEAARTVNFLGWYDYVPDDVLRRFEHESGIDVTYDVIDTNAVLETKLVTGHSGYDVVIPAASYMARQSTAGVYRPIDPTSLPNLARIDPGLQSLLERSGVDLRLGVPYMWGYYGVLYDTEKVAARLPGQAVNSWAIAFDPKLAARIEDCGLAMYDSAHFNTFLVYLWLGLDPLSEAPADLDRVESVLRSIRPYVRKITSVTSINDIAAREVCVSVGNAADVAAAQLRTSDSGVPFRHAVALPVEGSLLWVDMLAIPADAPHPAEAHALIDFLLRPEIAAANTTASGFANTIVDSRALLGADLAMNPAVWLPAEAASRLTPDRQPSEAAVRARNRVWTRFVQNDFE